MRWLSKASDYPNIVGPILSKVADSRAVIESDALAGGRILDQGAQGSDGATA
jgi:hypothetical protein